MNLIMFDFEKNKSIFYIFICNLSQSQEFLDRNMVFIRAKFQFDLIFNSQVLCYTKKIVVDRGPQYEVLLNSLKFNWEKYSNSICFSSYDQHVFGSELSIQCNYKNVTDDWRQLFKRRLFSTPESFGFHPVLGVLWWYDKFQLICYHATSQKCLLKYDLRCKVSYILLCSRAS